MCSPGPSTWKSLRKFPVLAGAPVGATPQRQSVAQRHGYKSLLPEDMDVRTPFVEGVDAFRSVPVVVARREVDRNRVHPRKGRPQELGSIRCCPVMLVEIAAAEECIRLHFVDEVCDPHQDVAQRLSASPRSSARRPRPREPRVKVDVGEVDDSGWERGADHVHVHYPSSRSPAFDLDLGPDSGSVARTQV